MLENVRNMLVLDGGAAMRYLVGELEGLGYRWAYRLVDSRFAGVPQRRQRVLFVAARDLDPRGVLFADDAGEPTGNRYTDDAFGFYWTEGLRGLGWAADAVPTLKGGSTVGIPSPPGIWWPDGPLGQRLVAPSLPEAEQLQGFPPGWTEPAERSGARRGVCWKLVGNAVTVGVSRWLGGRLRHPGEPCLEGSAIQDGDRWPTAAFGAAGKAWAVDASMFPLHERYSHLSEVVDLHGCFWHCCPVHGTIPKTNTDWWVAKLGGNVARDRDTDRRLEEAGWLVIRVWEHEGTTAAAARVIRAVGTDLRRSG